MGGFRCDFHATLELGVRLDDDDDYDDDDDDDNDELGVRLDETFL